MTALRLENPFVRRTRKIVLNAVSATVMGAALHGGAMAQASTPDKASSEQDIVVTASKFGSALERAPVAAVSLSPELLEQNHILTTKDLQSSVPGILIHGQGQFSTSFIRGIGTNSATAGVESPVATYIDGVYLQRQNGAVVDLVDVASVDVLKGPQGTLYGRNATGGALLIQTAAPTHEFGGYISAEYGRFSQTRLQAVVNIPLSSTLALRIAGQYRHNDGYLRNVNSGEKRGEVNSRYVRVRLRWEPSSSFTADYSFEYYNTHDETFLGKQMVPAPYCSSCVLAPTSAEIPPKDFYTTTYSDGTYGKNRFYSQTLTLAYTTDDFALTSISGWRNQATPFLTDLDFTYSPVFFGKIVEKGPTLTNDTYVRTTFDSPINAMAGFSLMRERDRQNFTFYGDILDIIGLTTGPGVNGNRVKIDSYSVYGELSYEFGDGFKLTGGARYNKDRKRIHVTNNTTGLVLFQLPPSAASFDRRASFDSVTPRAVLSYERGGSYYYASYNRGEKSGAYPSPLSDPSSDPADSEQLDNFEIGAKNSWLGGKAHTTLSLFYGKYRDIQVTVSDASKGAVVLDNAATAKLKGVEFTGDVRPVPDFDLGVGVTYLDNKFGKYQNAAVFAPAGSTDVICPPTASPIGLASCRADLSGTRLPHSPKWSGFVRASYTFHGLPEDWSALLAANAQFTSDFDFAAGAGGSQRIAYQSGYTKVDLNLTLRSPDETTEIGAYVSNLFQAHYYTFIAAGSDGGFGLPSMPRTFGIRVKRSF